MDFVQAGDLSQDLEDAISRRLADYTVAFISPDLPERAPDLLGTGVLVRVEGKHGILTAHHVLEPVRRESAGGRVCLLLGPTNHVESIDAGGLDFVAIGRGSNERQGPDLAAILLAPPIAGAIAAKKSFYDLTARRAEALNAPPAMHDGVWVANGFLGERSRVVEEDAGHRVKGFYNFSALGGPEAPETLGEYDYYDYLVTPESRAGSPRDWGGMSGGGIWQVQLRREGGSIVAAGVGLLSGILFYQHPTTATLCGVRGHGRESVYRVAYATIRGG